ncbi:T9SS type A sorting domain-containing protein [Hymenobacter tibetensis]|uniref:T9SS type A sorting domain-containing protein n=1 Tax=Hymenobacter tibetensis TaxID=497967 RepID=A0ABY4CYI4_9BACT|nr:T9SS type A sorting domain-containing protein [Hymenobacter tibetensis]UOG75077.1 T9SS type A sorting domain-containing protein [Hymenobacter tibetensis]
MKTNLYPLTSWLSDGLRPQLAAFATAMLLAPAAMAQAPANDNCAGAIALTTGTTCAVTTGTTVGATNGAAPSCGSTSGPASNDVWYRTVVPANGTVTVTTSPVAGSAFDDSVVEIFTGACGALTTVACNDDANGTLYSSATATGLAVGSTVYIRVFGYDASVPTGQFGICATTPVPLPANDAAVQIVYSVGKAPISSRQVIQATVRNAGSSVLTNLPVILTVTGTSPFTNGKVVPTLAVGATTTVTFDPYSPTTLGSNTVTVSVPADGGNTNNSQTYPVLVTANNLSYLNDNAPVTASVGVSSTTPGGTLASRYTINSASTIGEVRLSFLASATTTSTYQVVVLGATAAGLPSTVLFTSPTLSRPTTAGVVTVPVANVPVNGTFFVGLKEISGNVGIGYQVENPLRSGTFFYQIATGGVWTDVNTTTLQTRLGIEVGFSARVLSNKRSAALAQAIDVYPNPAHESFSLRLPAMAGQRSAKLTLLNTLGQQVQTRTVQLNASGTETQVNISGLAKGLYTLQIQTADQYTTKQVVVE